MATLMIAPNSGYVYSVALVFEMPHRVTTAALRGVNR